MPSLLLTSLTRGADGVHVHERGRGLDGHGADVQPGHDALHVGPVVGGQLDGGLQAVDGSVLAVAGIGGAGDDTGQLGAPGLGVVGGGVERDAGEAVVLPALEYCLDAGSLVLVPVHLADVAGGTVDDDVDLPVHVLQGSGDRDAGGVERLDALVGDVYVVSLGQRGLGLEVRPGLGDSDQLHVVLFGDCGRHSLSDGPVSVDCNPDFSHVVYLVERIACASLKVTGGTQPHERIGHCQLRCLSINQFYILVKY